MTYNVLVMMRSGREYKLTVSDEQLDELYAHKDIGKSRVYMIGLSTDSPDEIPWHKFFPGTKLYRVKADMPKQPRARKAKVMPMSASIGPIEFMAWPDIHKPMYVSGRL